MKTDKKKIKANLPNQVNKILGERTYTASEVREILDKVLNATLFDLFGEGGKVKCDSESIILIFTKARQSL